MSHPARGPVLTGIDGKAIAATRRSDGACIPASVTKASRMSHPARGPVLTGIDGKAIEDNHRPVTSDFCARLWSLILFAAMSGCQTPQDITVSDDPPWYQIAAEQSQKDTTRALKYYEQLLEMKGPDLTAELDNRRRSFEQNASDLNRVQLALLLSIPGSGFRDDNAAIALLRSLAVGKEGEDSSLRPLALLLHTKLIDLRRADETLQQQAAKLKDEQRRADALQNKLEALLELEMRMIEREQTSQPKSR